jgi:hypothetical protein
MQASTPPTNMDEFSDYSSSSEDSEYSERPKKRSSLGNFYISIKENPLSQFTK